MVYTFQWPTVKEKAGHKNTSIDPEERPYELLPTRCSGASKTSHANRKLVERQQGEMERRTSLLKDGLVYSYPTQRGKKRICAQNSVPLPRRPAFPFATRQLKSAPVQMVPVFQWPSIAEGSDQNTTQARSVMSYKYAPLRKRRVRFSKTDSDGCGSSAVGEANWTGFADVFDSTPTVSSQIMPKVVSRFSQKDMSTQHIASTADVEEHFVTTMSLLFWWGQT